MDEERETNHRRLQAAKMLEDIASMIKKDENLKEIHNLFRPYTSDWHHELMFTSDEHEFVLMKQELNDHLSIAELRAILLNCRAVYAQAGIFEAMAIELRKPHRW